LRETEILPFDDSLLEANVPVLTHQTNQAPHEDGPTHQDIKGAHEGLLDEYQTSLFPFLYSNRGGPIEQVRRIQQKKSAPSLLVLRSKPAGSLLYLKKQETNGGADSPQQTGGSMGTGSLFAEHGHTCPFV